MRVLLVVHGYPPRALAGTEVYTEALARALIAAGDEVTVLTREATAGRREYAVRREQRDGVEVVSINHTFRDARTFEASYRNPRIRAVGGALIAEARPEVAHVQHLTCLSTDIVLELAARRVPTVHTLHDFWLICQRGQLVDLDGQRCRGPHRGCVRCADAAAVGPKLGAAARAVRQLGRWLPERLAGRMGSAAVRGMSAATRGRASSEAMNRRTAHVRWVARHVGLFLAPSATVSEAHLDFGLSPDRMRRWELGIDPRPLTGITRAPAKHLRLGFLGSLSATKAPHLLLEAFSGLPAGAASVDVFGGFVPYHGDFSYRRRLQPLLGLPGVRHHGPVPRSEVAARLAAVDILVVPSVWLENAPLVIREAALAGVPVVASDLGGMAEAVEDGVSGLLFRPGDAADLKRCLRRLLEEPELLPRLRRGLPAVRTVDDEVEELRAVYQAVPPLPAPPHLAAVVLNYRTPRETVLAARSLTSSRRPVNDILVIDNASGNGSAEQLRRDLPANTRLLETDANLGFAGGCNVGIREALARGGELVFLLNGDAMVAPDTLERLEEALAEDPEAGIAGPILLAASDPRWIATSGISYSAATGRMLHPESGQPWQGDSPLPRRRVSGVAGCALLLRREVVEAVGLFDESLFFSFEDLDLCLRAAASGWTTLSVGDAVAYHHGGRSLEPGSPRRLYYATRNHLGLAARTGSHRWPLPFLRRLAVVGYNLVFALVREGPRGSALRAVARGVADHLRGRGGPG